MEHEIIVTAMRNILKDRDDVDVLESNVDPQAGVPEPEEVRGQLGVGGEVGRAEGLRGVQVLQEHVVGVVHFQSWIGFFFFENRGLRMIEFR